MEDRTVFSKIVYCWRPLIIFMIFSICVSALLEGVWTEVLRDRILAGTESAYAYTAQTVWGYLCLVVPSGVGVLSVRREVVYELHARARAGGLLPELSGRAGSPGQTVSRGERTGNLIVVCLAAAALSLGINLLFSLTVLRGSEASASSLPGLLPGPFGMVLQAAVYGIYMPLIEELVFRGLLFGRCEREFGLRAGLLVSGLLFGIYHASPVQWVYAAVMGMVFAAAYAASGDFSVS
ncbi:MAG: CPBP family intramembrane metalloprotease, partial [Lachnospiraceae bacterium]|nr:CPBP family intramembrane metalloprotease [Lachnospiraceae bacterium]